MNKDRGFSVLGFLAAAIVLLIVAIMIPFAFRTDRGCCPETAAVANLRTFNTAEVTYRELHGNYGTLQELISAGLVDERFLDTVSLHKFSVTVSGSDYTAMATPTSTKAGRYGYYSTREQIVRYQTTMIPGKCDPCFPPDHSGQPVQ